MKQKPLPHTSPRCAWWDAPHIWILLLVVCTFYMYWPQLTRQKFFWFDVNDHIVTKLGVTARSLAAGRLPMWDVYSHGGQSIVGDPTYALFYPFHVMLAAGVWLCGGYNAGFVNWAVVAETLFGCLGMFLMAKRNLRLSNVAAFASAVIFMFSTPVVVRLIQYMHYTEIVLIPWMLLGIMGLRNSGAGYGALMTLLWMVTLLGNNLQYSYFIAIAAGLYALVDIVTLAWAKRDGRMCAALLAKYAMVFLCGVGLAFMDLLPKYEVSVKYCPRLESGDMSLNSGTPLAHFVTYLVPGWFGTVAGSPPAQYFDVDHMQNDMPNAFWLYWEFSQYVGITALVLAAIGMWRGTRTRAWWYLVLLIAFSWLYAYGVNNPLPGALPFGASFRIPAKFLVFAAFAFSLFAGMGLDALIARRYSARALGGVGLAIIGVAVMAFLAVSYAVSPGGTTGNGGHAECIRQGVMVSAMLLGVTGLLVCIFAKRPNLQAWFLAGCLILVLADALGHNRGFNQGLMDPRVMYRASPGVRKLQAELADNLFRIRGNQLYDGRMTGVEHRLHTLEGNIPTLTKWYLRIRGGAQHNYQRFLDLYNVKYEIKLTPEGAYLEQNTACLARAFVVRQVEVVPESNVVARIYEPSFNPRTTMLVTPEFSDLVSGTTGGPPDSVKITRYGATRIVIEAVLGSPGYLVLIENRYPSWRVRVDGVPARGIDANYAFRGVALNAGAHTVEWTYRPDALIKGGIVSVASAVALCVCLFAVRRHAPVAEKQPRRQHNQNPTV